MSDERFKDKGTAIGRFIEECGECIHAAGKGIRFGWDSMNPLTGTSDETNKECLYREIKDLESAIKRLKEEMYWRNP